MENMITIKDILSILTIRRKIFIQVEQLSKLGGYKGAINGKRLVEVFGLIGMISRYGMPWDFIKHYINAATINSIDTTLRFKAIICYMQHTNATVYTLDKLLSHLWYEGGGSEDDDDDGFKELKDHLNTQHFDVIVKNNRLDILQYINDRHLKDNNNNNKEGKGGGRIIRVTKQAFDNACERRDNLELITFLHNTGNTCTSLAMDIAACYGNINIIQFLYLNRSEGCSVYAVNDAATAGHIETIKYLFEIGYKECSKSAMDRYVTVQYY
ncbi:hypothetical protein DFA_06445 [Cavenderia fasciculata]|uniref:Ankyrin repeat-containing protein n=1 Tax=Cavenderia fasciculata TaxID=261658 RepID=F4PJ09_CACFS|nr:uncharacterized protein DFA_06445 [Cavenderia fasciculata]EGG24295.1 hypothetical protein DFA_06445 [Cavenderia fasciculata]|eukprot:XP_004362146.1 hypothetical protein DFA_06445 [Cavenderia fasciculata]